MSAKTEMPPAVAAAPTATRPVSGPTVGGHLRIMRPDYWVKNVFVLPGIAVALMVYPDAWQGSLVLSVLLGLISTCLVASSNYVLNEILDAPFDRQHPTKCDRPVPSGRVWLPLGYAQWFGLMAAGVGLGALISPALAATLLALWVMGCVYNVPPVRSKDLPYIDVLTEAVNNPLRMLIGWFIVGSANLVPVSLLLSYWMIGAFFMAIKRFAEFRHINDGSRAAKYRKSFAYYTEARLLNSIVFYVAAAMMFFGAFTIRYRVELVLAFPFIAAVIAVYFDMGFKHDSAAASPERLYREPALMVAVCVCVAVITVLFLTDIPFLRTFFASTVPSLMN